jgi:hypothetical protein
MSVFELLIPRAVVGRRESEREGVRERERGGGEAPLITDPLYQN